MNMRKPTHPGGVLKNHYLMPLGLTVTEVAAALKIARKTLSQIVNGHAAVTPILALRLSRAFDTSPELWLNLQQNYDLWHAGRGSPAWRKVPVLSQSAAA